jgi:hypothetical protein
MDPSLGFLREWLPFAGAGHADRAAGALREWLAAQGALAEDERARRLTGEIKRLLATQGNPQAQARILAAADDAAGTLLPALEMQVAAAPLPLAPDASRAAVAADNLLKTLAGAQAELAARLAGRPLNPALTEVLGQSLAGAAAALFRRQLLAYRAYAPASPSSWQALHRLYGLALAGKAALPAPFASVETHYQAALLLALADPMKFPRGALPLLRAQCERMALHARLYPTVGHKLPESASLFLVTPAEGRPARPLARDETGRPDEGYILDCNPAVGALRKELAARELAAAQTGGEDPELAVMSGLLAMWRGHPQRRFSRTRFKPRGELVAGLEDLVAALSGAALLRRRGEDRPAAAAPVVSEWAIVDESPDGFGIRFLKGDMRRLDVGDVVAFRPREQSRAHLCLIRRITNGGPTQLELGLQELSPAAQLVGLPARPGAAAGPAIFLPAMPAFRGAPGLVAASGCLAVGQSITVPGGGPRGQRLAAVRLLQRGEHTSLYQLNALPGP